jgi:plasmid stability protein
MEMTMIKIPKYIKDKLKLKAAEHHEPMYKFINRMLREWEKNEDNTN